MVCVLGRNVNFNFTSPSHIDKVVNLANDMSANVRSLRDACNALAAQVTDQEARRKLQNLADDSMRSMSELIQRSADWSDEGRRVTVTNIHTVNGNIDRLVSFITSISEFGGEPARISSEGRNVSICRPIPINLNCISDTESSSCQAQQPICAAGQACLESGRGVILASKHMLQTAETNGQPSDTAFGAFTAASRDLTTNTKHLLALLKLVYEIMTTGVNLVTLVSCDFIFTLVNKVLVKRNVSAHY